MNNQPIAQSSIVIHSKPDHLPSVRTIIETTASQAGFPVEDVQRMVTAAFEAAVNAITHGSPHGKQNKIEIQVRIYTDKLVVEVTDQGPGFNGRINRKMPDSRSIRGRGIPLMHALVDDVRFSNNDGGKVTLTKYRSTLVKGAA